MLKLKRINQGTESYPIYVYDVYCQARVKGTRICKARISKNKQTQEWSLMGRQEGECKFITLIEGYRTKKEALEDLQWEVDYYNA